MKPLTIYWNVYIYWSNSPFSLQVRLWSFLQSFQTLTKSQITLINDQHTRSGQIQCKKRCDYNFSIENTTPIKVHCSSNVILAIEYFINSKGERQNIKLLSTQNNHSPSFGLKKLVIFFISSDKTDETLCRSWKYKTRCRTKRRGGLGMAFDQGASRPQGTITVKSTGAPQIAWRLKLKKI